MKRRAPISTLLSQANDKKGTVDNVKVRDSSPAGARFTVVLSYVGHLGQAFLPVAVLSPLAIWLVRPKGKRHLPLSPHTRVKDTLGPASTVPLTNGPVLPRTNVGSGLPRVGDCLVSCQKGPAR